MSLHPESARRGDSIDGTKRVFFVACVDGAAKTSSDLVGAVQIRPVTASGAVNMTIREV